jgi:hypothetical protein
VPDDQPDKDQPDKDQPDKPATAIVEHGSRRKRIVVGAGVMVGVLALVVVGYLVAAPGTAIRAHCVDVETKVIVEDTNCVTPAGAGVPNVDTAHPIFVGSGGRLYRYNFGGTGSLGRPVEGGTAAVPKKGVPVITSSGRPIADASGSGPSFRARPGMSGGGS